VKSLLISSTYFPPQVGGISHFMAEISRALGPDLVCCLTGVPANRDESAADLGLRVYRCPAAASRARHRQALALGTALAYILVRERPRVIQLATANEGYIGLRLHDWFGLPFVVYAHGNEVLAAIESAWAKPRAALRRAACVLANSRFTAGLVQRAGVPAERIAIVHPGCDVERFRPLPPDPDVRRRLLGARSKGPVILTVGGLVARKGHDMVIRALPRVRRRVPDVTYLVVGDGPERARLDALATELGVRGHVVFGGTVPAPTLPQVYALCDVFVMPSREEPESNNVEGFGLVFLEANACAKPVVGGRSGGVAEAIVDGVTGLLVNPTVEDSIAESIVQLLSDRELAQRLGRQGRDRVCREFSWVRVAQRVRSILDDVVIQTRGSGTRARHVP
jgi:phosphatidylinositol alpha-1,6-mannosyltransferase